MLYLSGNSIQSNSFQLTKVFYKLPVRLSHRPLFSFPFHFDSIHSISMLMGGKHFFSQLVLFLLLFTFVGHQRTSIVMISVAVVVIIGVGIGVVVEQINQSLKTFICWFVCCCCCLFMYSKQRTWSNLCCCRCGWYCFCCVRFILINNEKRKRLLLLLYIRILLSKESKQANADTHRLSSAATTTI